MRFVTLMLLTLLATGCSRQYFIVRHAEKASTPAAASDPPLSPDGTKRAEALRQLLAGSKIKRIYATPTQRAVLTAKPLSKALAIPIEAYGPLPDQKLLQQLKAYKKNVLVVGHSNTVDDLVNGLMGSQELQDLPDSVYGRLYIIRLRGQKTSLRQVNY